MEDRTHRTFPPARSAHFEHVQDRWRWAHQEFLRLLDRIEHLEAEVYRLTVDRDHWYAAATYTPDELHEMYMRASQGRDPETGEWLWPDGVRTTAH